MNWKIVVVGGLVFFVVTWIVGFGTGPLIHEGVLKDSYVANSQFWVPALNQDPPDMAALLPQWIGFGLLTSLLYAGLYGVYRSALSGPPWKKGLVFGLTLALVQCALTLGWSVVFNLPSKIWIWWSLEGFLYFLIGGAALGWVAHKLAPEG
jgi:hypothetical protein